MRFVATLSLTCLAAMVQGQDGQVVRQLHLKLGYVSEIRLPESCLRVKGIHDKLLEIEFIDGLERRILTVVPKTDKKGATNLRIYTPKHAFNVEVSINQTARPTRSLDLTTNIHASEMLTQTVTEPAAELASLEVAATPDDVASPLPDTDAYSIERLSQELHDFLQPGSRAMAIERDRILFAVDRVFYHAGRIVLKLYLANKSETPYDVTSLNVRYQEHHWLKLLGMRLFRGKVSKDLELQSFYQEFSPAPVCQPGQAIHCVFVIENAGVRDDGVFSVKIREKGHRSIKLTVPSYVESLP